jgi:predicted amidophosphoribosyltransferase
MSNVIAFPAKRAPAPCRHRGANLNHETRTCTCRECGLEVDAFDHLVTMAADWGFYSEWLTSMKAEAEKLHAELEQLRKDRDALRGAP